MSASAPAQAAAGSHDLSTKISTQGRRFLGPEIRTFRPYSGRCGLISGASTAQVTPDPIPNSEVKLREADDSWTQLGPAKVSRCRLCKNPSKEGFLLCGNALPFSCAPANLPLQEASFRCTSQGSIRIRSSRAAAS